MHATDTNSGISRELGEAIDELHVALQRATEATSQIRALVPRIGALGNLFDDIEAVLQTGRQHLGADAQPPATYARPTLLVPSPAPALQPQLWPEAAVAAPVEAPRPERAAPFSTTPTMTYEPLPPPAVSAPEPGVVEPIERRAEELTCFRLEFESRPGPLDLRTVDDAVSEHPAVRDVALLDYDGRKATLKVWITSLASPADVQRALSERAGKIFASGNDVTIIALEDVA